MNGFGFISNKNQSEFYLGYFEDDAFVKGFWMKNEREILIGEFFYKGKNKIKNEFKGIMINIRECDYYSAIRDFKYELKFGYFKFKKNELSGYSIHVNEFNEIEIKKSLFSNEKNNLKNLIINIFKDNFPNKINTKCYNIKLEIF